MKYSFHTCRALFYIYTSRWWTLKCWLWNSSICLFTYFSNLTVHVIIVILFDTS